MEKKERTGELYLVLESLISGFFPIVALLTYKYITPIFSLFISSLFALVFFVLLLALKNRWYQLKDARAYRDIFFSSFFIMLLFLLFYLGLERTTPSNAAVILFMQVFFSYVFFRVFKNERLKRAHIFGALLMSVGAFMILFPGHISVNSGDLLILCSAMIAPVANYFQKNARAYVDSEVLLFFRTLLALPLLALLAFLLEEIPSVENLKNVFWLLVFNGFLAFGLSKIFWVEAIFRVSVTKAAAMAAMTPFFTMFFSALLLNQIPTIYQIIGALPIVIGAFLITRNKNA